MIEKLRKTENLHILLWLTKDICWVLDFKVLGVIMIVPAVSVAVWLTWKLRSHVQELIHNLAVCFWLAANSVWMIGEFFYDDTTRPVATVFFLCGLGTLALFYIPHWLQQITKRGGVGG